MDTVGSVLETDDNVVALAEKEETSATTLLRVIDRFKEKIADTVDEQNKTVSISKKNVALQVSNVFEHSPIFSEKKLHKTKIFPLRVMSKERLNWSEHE